MKKILFSIIALFLISPALWAQSDSNSWGTFIPYDSTQTVEVTFNNFDELNVRGLGLEEPGRFLSIDPMSHKYPSWSPYVYVMNNPTRFIDPDGREVRCYSESQCDQLVSDLRELYSDAPVDYEKRTETRRTFWGREKTTEYYTITVDGDSEFDWAQDDYTLALFDAIVSEDVIFDVIYTDQIPHGGRLADGTPRTADGQQLGGGFFSRTGTSRATVYVDPRGDTRVGDPSSIILMHEMIGHGHPVATSHSTTHLNAHDINRFYQQKLGIQPRAGYQTPHRGYQGQIYWPKTNLYPRR